MHESIRKKRYHIEILPPKQNTENLEKDLQTFADKYNRVMESGHCVCLTDNAMGLLAFQGTEVIEEMGLPVVPEQVMIHLTTFHTKENLDDILRACQTMGIRTLLIVTGDGSDRLPKLQPADVDATGVESVTSVELLGYIRRAFPDTFALGVAFNPYEPKEHEFEKLKRKLDAGATFLITQPLVERNSVVDTLLETHPGIPVIVEAWMSKNLHLLSSAVGYEIPETAEFDPLATLRELHHLYPKCGVYLSLLGFKTQYDSIANTWV